MNKMTTGKSGDKFQALVESVTDRLEEMSMVAGAGVRRLAVIRRDIGEQIIRAFSPAAAAEKLSFNELDADKREAYRQSVENSNRAEMAKLSEMLNQRGLPKISTTLLYDCVKLAAAFTEPQIDSWIDRGLSMTNLLQTSGFTDQDDRERACAVAVETGRTSVEAFDEVMREVEADSEIGLRPSAKAAKKAADTKKKKGEKRGRDTAPPDSLPMAEALLRFKDAVDNKHRVAFEDIWALLQSDYEELSLSDQDAAQAALDELASPLEAMRAAIDLILKFRRGADGGTGSKTGGGKARRQPQ